MPMELLDLSTRSTDVMLEPSRDGSHSHSSLAHRKGLNYSSDDEHDENSPNQTLSKSRQQSQFAHLVPKKHTKMAKVLENQHKNITETTFRFDDKYRYQLWEGKNKFLCGGRLMLGAHDKHLLITLVLLIVTYSLFLGLIVPLLEFPLLFYIGLFLCIGTLVFLLLTAFTEPGIIPRRPPSKLLESLAPDVREKVQYCHTCRIVRPPRAKHCRYCDNCVEVFDHHCPWTGTCIGVRNYSYFCTFITLTTIASAYACAVTAYLIFRWIEGFDHFNLLLTYIRDTIAPIVCVFTFLVFCLVGSLLAFHLFLIGRQQTTNEFLRGVRPTNSDYKNSTTGNVVRLCYRTVPETKLLPMWEKCKQEDLENENNAVAHAIHSLRSAIENNA
jgi:palmitoyltransferase ZDHHC9/14/18